MRNSPFELWPVKLQFVSNGRLAYLFLLCLTREFANVDCIVVIIFGGSPINRPGL